MKKGFTLIELLVVVLIIGILASIAVPNYMTATRLSKVRAHLPIAKAIYEANQVYYLAHGVYSKDLDELDVSADYTFNQDQGYQNEYLTPWGKIYISNTNYVALRFTDFGITIDFFGPLEENGISYYGDCYGNDAVCSQFGGQIMIPSSSHWSGTNVYYMSN